jgi:hypothetical protein
MFMLLLPLTLCRSEKYVWSGLVWSVTSNEWNSSITGWISFQLIMYLFRNSYMIFEFFIDAKAYEALVMETTTPIHFWSIFLIDTWQWFIGIYFKFSLYSVTVICRSPCLFVCLGFDLSTYSLNMYLLILATYQHWSCRLKRSHFFDHMGTPSSIVYNTYLIM